MPNVCVSKTISSLFVCGCVATQPVEVQVQLFSVPYDEKTLMVKAIIVTF